MELLRIIPKAWVSFLIGKLASIELPAFLAQPLLQWFVNRYSIDTSIMKQPLTSYRSVASLFTRELRDGLRPIGVEPVSPVDGTVRTSGPIDNLFLEQIKGIRYSLPDLLRDSEEADRFQNGFFLNLYLSPQDYHRIHSPVSGCIRKMTHIPGTLWPVNDWSVRSIPELFTINERIVTYITTPYGEVAVVMIGATNVGKMTLSYDVLVTNQTPWKPASLCSTKYTDQKLIAAGAPLGVFHLGSSVVVLFNELFREKYPLKEFKGHTKINFGSSIGYNNISGVV